jgi:hypothetical protein
MKFNFPDRSKSTESLPDCVFNDLRRTLAQETPCRRLADLLESVNAMHRARSTPGEFDLRFEEFVYRAEDYMAAVRPFFPALVAFLSSHGAGGGIEPRNVDGSTHSDVAVTVA